MIKLKPLIKEVTLGQGHAGGTLPLSLRGFIIDLCNASPKLKTKLDDLIDMKDTLLAVESITLLSLADIEPLTEPIPGYPNLRLWVAAIKFGRAYRILDFTARTIGDFFVGTIEGSPTNVSVAYSPQAVFDLSALQIFWSGVAPQFRGMGYGKLLYRIALQKEGTLYSDNSLFKASYGMWTTYLPSIASWYGGLLRLNWAEDLLMPIMLTSKETLSKDFAQKSLAGFVASVNPSKGLRKLGYNLSGLSFTRGDYMVVGITDSIERGYFAFEHDVDQDGQLQGGLMDVADAVDAADSIPDLLESFERGQEHGSNSKVYIVDPNKYTTNLSLEFNTSQVAKAKTLVIWFSDAVAIIKDTGGSLSLTLL